MMVFWRAYRNLILALLRERGTLTHTIKGHKQLANLKVASLTLSNSYDVGPFTM